MKNRRLAAISFAISIILHTLLFIIIISFAAKEYKNNIYKKPKQYFVDIVTLKKPHKIKKTEKKEKHKIAANLQRKGVAKKYSKTEEIPLKTAKIKPQRIKKPVISKPAKKIAGKIKKEKKKVAKKRSNKSILKNKAKNMAAIKKIQKNRLLAKKKKTFKKAPKTIKISGGLYNPKAIASNKNTSGELSGASKEYKYKNAKREATVTLGTQSLKYASYMQHIKDKIQNVWIYPAQARMNNQQGALLVLFSIDKNGRVVKIKLLRSSGYPLLDNAAIEAVKDAAPFPPLPARLHIDRLNIYATFLYRLGFYYVD